MNVDGGLRVDFDTEHDHEAVDDETKNENKVGDISEGFPDGEDRRERIEAVTTVSIGRDGDFMILEVIFNVG